MEDNPKRGRGQSPERANEPAWRQIDGGSRGTVFDINKLDKLSGSEIYIDQKQMDTTLGQMCFLKWQEENRSTIVIQTVGNYILTNVKVGGKLYPTEIRLIQGISPLVLGRDFLSKYKWNNPIDSVIETPNGVVYLKTEEDQQYIDEKRTADQVQCEEVFFDRTYPNSPNQKITLLFWALQCRKSVKTNQCILKKRSVQVIGDQEDL